MNNWRSLQRVQGTSQQEAEKQLAAMLNTLPEEPEQLLESPVTACDKVFTSKGIKPTFNSVKGVEAYLGACDSEQLERVIRVASAMLDGVKITEQEEAERKEQERLERIEAAKQERITLAREKYLPMLKALHTEHYRKGETRSFTAFMEWFCKNYMDS